jgi:hypothetical protein
MEDGSIEKIREIVINTPENQYNQLNEVVFGKIKSEFL